ncbi:MAG: 50S ribosomal protein L21 [Bacteriovoracaceae bacterium]|nr:50S ribosomal protein L21 [Bacteriovoracaceae bacterium]
MSTYAIAQIQGHQYRINVGEILDVEQFAEAKLGDKLEFDQVLYVGGKEAVIGKPTVKGAKIVAEVIKQGKGPKVIIFKRKPGRYNRKTGHRQPFTGLRIKEIHDGQGNVTK